MHGKRCRRRLFLVYGKNYLLDRAAEQYTSIVMSVNMLHQTVGKKGDSKAQRFHTRFPPSHPGFDSQRSPNFSIK